MYKKELEQFRLAVGDKPVKFVANHEIAQCRSRLIKEECDELLIALQEEDEEQVLKEICDVLYVVFGTVVTYDLPVERAFKIVHENNMLKINYPRNEKGKIVKPVDHPKVNLKEIIKEHREEFSLGV